MSIKIQFKRGLNANFGSLSLSSGEPCFVTDTKKLYIGDGVGKFLINPDPFITSVNSKTGDVTISANDIGLGNVTNESKSNMFNNPTFTGSATAPTQIATDNSTKIATTEFVKSQGYMKNTDNIDGGTF